MAWNEHLAENRSLIIPMQPGFGQTPRLDWIMNYRDLGGLYAQITRELKADPIDVIGFSAGAYIAAEMAAADPRIFSKMVLVAPMGIKPRQGEILDFFELTIRRHLRATVADPHLLSGVKIPTLLIWGTRDQVVPRGCIDAYQQALAAAQVATIEGVGHRPEIENEPQFSRLVTQFLKD
jgi:pimeloyl-ACP methyl ester carboxylesterase